MVLNQSLGTSEVQPLSEPYKVMAESGTWSSPAAAGIAMNMGSVPAAAATTEAVSRKRGNSSGTRQRSRRKDRGRRGGSKGGGRLWQLPQSSIEGYAKWIADKPCESQTPAEQHFLQKYHRRLLVRQHKLPSESMKQYVARLEAKENASDIEIQLIEQYHRRKAHKRAQRRQQRQQERGSTKKKRAVPPPIFWKRHHGKQQQKQQAATPGTLALMSNLQESMDRLGLSSDKLRDAPMST